MLKSIKVYFGDLIKKKKKKKLVMFLGKKPNQLNQLLSKDFFSMIFLLDEILNWHCLTTNFLYQ